MKKIISLKALLPIILFLLFCIKTDAEMMKMGISEKSSSSNIFYTDSLLNVFENSIYESFYNPAFWKKKPAPTFTVLKIEVGEKGEIKDIRFSDSADTLFVNAFLMKAKFEDDKSTFELYARAKGYKSISILIPVSYEPFYSPKRSFEDPKINGILKFEKKDFTGKSVILTPILVKVLSQNNM